MFSQTKLGNYDFLAILMLNFNAPVYQAFIILDWAAVWRLCYSMEVRSVSYS